MKIMRRNKNKARKDFTHSPKQTVVRYDCYARGHVTSLTANRHLDVTYLSLVLVSSEVRIVGFFGFQEVVHDGLTWSTHRISFHFLSVVGNKSFSWMKFYRSRKSYILCSLCIVIIFVFFSHWKTVSILDYSNSISVLHDKQNKRNIKTERNPERNEKCKLGKGQKIADNCANKLKGEGCKI